MTPASARSPSASARASMTMDLPAPVSPVSTVRPASSSSSRRSMMAKSRMARCASISELLAPEQLLAQHVEVTAAGRVDELHRRLGAAHVDMVVVLERIARLAVEADIGLVL